jgi:hypothetical protein
MPRTKVQKHRAKEWFNAKFPCVSCRSHDYNVALAAVQTSDQDSRQRLRSPRQFGAVLCRHGRAELPLVRPGDGGAECPVAVLRLAGAQVPRSPDRLTAARVNVAAQSLVSTPKPNSARAASPASRPA